MKGSVILPIGKGIEVVEDLLLPRIPVADLTAKGVKMQFTAHQNQVFGDVCRVNSNGRAQIADASEIGTATALLMLIDATASANTTANYLLFGVARRNTWNWVVGNWVFLSRNGVSGQTLTQTNIGQDPTSVENEVIQILGVANSAQTILFNPQLVQIEYRISGV